MATVQLGKLFQILDGLRNFIAVDSHEAVTVRDLHRETRSKKVVKPKFTTDFPGAVIREGADELTLRAHETGVLRTFIDTSNVGDQRWWPPQVDADWHPVYQAIFFRESKDQSGKPCITTARALPRAKLRRYNLKCF